MIIYGTHTVPLYNDNNHEGLIRLYVTLGVVLGAIVFVVPEFTVLT